MRWVLAAALLLAGCFGPAYDPTREAVIGPGATEGACDAWLANATVPSAVVRLEAPEGVEGVEATVDGEAVGFRKVDGNACAAFPFLRAGLYRFNVWGSCTALAETHWNGTGNVEVWIPYYGNACV